MAILRLEWTPRAKGAVKSAGKSAKYYTFREGDDQAARIWYARDGRMLEYTEAREMIRTNARTHGYTYRVMVSTKDSPLRIEDYRQVMDTLGEKLGVAALAHALGTASTGAPHAITIGTAVLAVVLLLSMPLLLRVRPPAAVPAPQQRRSGTTPAG